MRRGLRQGCPAAPFIFAAWSVRINRILNIRWCQDHLSYFADDVHAFWQILSTVDFQKAKQDIARIITTIQEKRMKVNLEKSAVVLLLRSQASSLV